MEMDIEALIEPHCWGSVPSTTGEDSDHASSSTFTHSTAAVAAELLAHHNHNDEAVGHDVQMGHAPQIGASFFQEGNSNKLSPFWDHSGAEKNNDLQDHEGEDHEEHHIEADGINISDWITSADVRYYLDEDQTLMVSGSLAVGENEFGSVETAKNHARNLAADMDGNYLLIKDELKNGKDVKIEALAYYCKQ